MNSISRWVTFGFLSVTTAVVVAGGRLPDPPKPLESKAPSGSMPRGLRLAALVDQANPASDPPNSKLLVGYFPSYTATGMEGPQERLRKIPPYFGVVNLAFMRPNATYQTATNDDLKGRTGLEFGWTYTKLHQALEEFRKANPNTKVLVSVGGQEYSAWNEFNAKAIVQFVHDFALDGVDLDFEFAASSNNKPYCHEEKGKWQCTTDKILIGSIKTLRDRLNAEQKNSKRSLLLTATIYHVAAFGQDQWRDSKPPSDYTGIAINALRSQAQNIDFVNLMAYDAGSDYTPQEAFEACAHYYPGPVMIGVTPAPESWGGHAFSLEEISALSRYARASKRAGGMMLWFIGKEPAAPSDTPGSKAIAQSICTTFSLQNCGD